MIHQGRILEDDAFVFHPLDALMHGCGAEVDFRGNLADGDLRIVLQQAQNSPILFIEQERRVSRFLCFGPFLHSLLLFCYAKFTKYYHLF